MDGTDRETHPAWMPGLAESIRASRASLPSAMLADAMCQHGEDPRNDGLWHLRLDQLDGLLFGKAVRR